MCDMTRDKFLSIADGYYSEFEALKDASNFYDYEKSLVELMQKLSCKLMEEQLNDGSVSEDRRKKKL